MKTADFSSTQYSCPSHAYGAVMLSETLLKEDKPNRDRKKKSNLDGQEYVSQCSNSPLIQEKKIEFQVSAKHR